jgi:hypothetical protein
MALSTFTRGPAESDTAGKILLKLVAAQQTGHASERQHRQQQKRDGRQSLGDRPSIGIRVEAIRNR